MIIPRPDRPVSRRDDMGVFSGMMAFLHVGSTVFRGKMVVGDLWGSGMIFPPGSCRACFGLKRMIRLVFGIIFIFFLSMTDGVIAHEIMDATGKILTFHRPFKRIISLYGAHTENLFYLGLDQEIIGVSRNETYPDGVKTKPWFSYHDDPEKFLVAGPDLVLVRPMIERGYPGLIQRLRKFGIVVVSLQPSTVDGLYDYWLTLGVLTGRKNQAEAMVKAFKSRIVDFSRLTQQVKTKKRVYFEAIHSRMKTFVPGSMAIFVLESAGGINVATDALSSRGTNIGIYGKERILSHAHEIDVFLAQTGVMNNTSVDMIKQEPGFNIIRAVRENQIYLIDETLVSRPVFRLVIGIETIGKILYPELFTK